MKKVIAGFLCLGILLCAGCSSSESSAISDKREDTLTQEEIQALVDQKQAEYQMAMDNLEKVKENLFEEKEEPQKEPPEETEYIEVTAQKMLEELDANPVKAELSYLHKYVAVTGLLNNSISTRTFSVVHDIAIDTLHDSGTIFCTVDKDDESYYSEFPKDNEHKEITVWGKVSSVSDDLFSISIDVIKYELAPEPEAGDIEFLEITTDDLMKTYDVSPSAAQQEYLNKYVVFTGTIDSIRSDCLVIKNPCVTTSRGGLVYCYYSSDEIKAIVAEKNEGDTVVISGRVTDIQEALRVHYKVDILALE